jgi:LL-diaminopimelate aminotransferase
MQPAQRVTNIPLYPFATLNATVQKLEAEGAQIIRLDMGNPDLPPPAFMLAALKAAIDDPTQHGYPGYFGTPALRRAIATYYHHRFGVTLDPETETVPLIGSKEGLANFHLAWLDPGDLCLTIDPSYPVHLTAARLANARCEVIPTTAAAGWKPDFDRIPQALAARARMIWLCYPNNPTGATADLEFFERAIAFCRRHEILLCHDLAYGDITFDGYNSPSALQIPGAKEVVIEFNSLSKTYNIPGWRVGMAVGNRVAVQALAKIKTQIDTGMPHPVQAMAVAALTGDQGWLAERNQIYQERRDILLEALRTMGIALEPPQASLYIWFPTPPGYSSTQAHERMLHEAHICVAPGSFYGPAGEGWLRMSVTGGTAEALRQAMVRLRRLVW